MADTITTNQRDIGSQARLRTYLRRRRRFWRSVALFAFLTTVIVVLALANRDTQKYGAVLRQADRIAEALQANAAQRRALPLRLPDLGQSSASISRVYHFNLYYAGQAKWRNPVGVCCYKKPVSFFVLHEGRPVVLYDGHKFHAEWRSEKEFQAEAESLGFGELSHD